MIPEFWEIVEQNIWGEIRKKGIFFENSMKALLGICGFFRKYLKINLGKLIFHSLNKKIFGGDLVYILSGGAKNSESNAKFYFNMGLHYWNTYASTESNVPITSISEYDLSNYKTAGNVNRSPYIKIKIYDPDEKGIGKILVKSELIMKGYFRDPETTKKSFIGEYFDTGDLGYIKNNNLIITGRVKETVILHNGKKVSTVDIDNFYSELLKGKVYASCGIPIEDKSKRFDEVHMFIERGFLSKAEMKKLEEDIYSFANKNKANNYKIKKVHFIEKMPLTLIKKVKLYELRNIAAQEEKAISEVAENSLDEKTNNVEEPENQYSTTDKILLILKKISKRTDIQLNSNLKKDVALDSLDIFNLGAEIKGLFNVDISNEISNKTTVNDLIDMINSPTKLHANPDLDFDIDNYPMKKGKIKLLILRTIMLLMRFIYKFDIKGLENIPLNRNFIIAANHKQTADPVFIMTFLPFKIVKKVNCLVAIEQFRKKFIKNLFLNPIGAIPVIRTGNTSVSIKKCEECLRGNDSVLIIHPEGEQIGGEELAEFKSGVSQISIDTQTEVVPVRIKGTNNIFRGLEKVFPKLIDLKNMKRYRISVSFGKPINPSGKKTDKLTQLIKESIENL